VRRITRSLDGGKGDFDDFNIGVQPAVCTVSGIV
jgi:hypothetical protein